MSIKNFYCIIILLLVLPRTFAQQPDLVSHQDIIGNGTDAFTYVPPPSSFTDGLRTATFNVSYNGFTPEAQDAFQYAVDIWASILISNVPIKINAYILPLPNGTLGFTLPNGRKDFVAAPVSSTWYPTSLANKLTDSELNPGEADMDLAMTTSANWYFGTDGNCPAGKYDFTSVVLHEIGHGLGFAGLAKDSADIGSFGLLNPNDFMGASTSFPFPDLDTLPSIFDSHLQITTGESLILDFINPSTGLGDEFTSNGVFFSGTEAMAMNGGIRPRIYAPFTFDPGSSMVHLNESSYPVGNINELMTPFISPASSNHDPGPATIGILKDIGWEVNYSVGVENIYADEEIQLFPNPVTTVLQIAGYKLQFAQIELMDETGRVVKKMSEATTNIDVRDLSSGIYLLKVTSGGKSYWGKFVKQ